MLISCGYDSYPSENQKVFRMLLPAGLSSLDPAYARDQSNAWMVSQIFNGLVQLDSQLQVQPCIAHSWEIQDSGKVYIFHLRGDVVFHDAPSLKNRPDRRVKASDFVYSFNRIANPATASFGQWVFSGKVQNVYSSDNDIFTGYSGFRAVNDSTLEIRLVRPFPAFLSLLTMPYAAVVPREAVELPGIAFRSRPVGTGPFRFKSWREGESLILLKNPEYFETQAGERLPRLEAVRVEFSPGPLTAFHKLVQGEIDFLNRPDLSLKDELFDATGALQEKWQNDFFLVRKPQLNTEYLGIQMDSSLVSGPLRNLYVRKAMAFGINRDQIVGAVLKGMGFAAHGGMVPPGMPFSDTARVIGIRFNPDSCRHYLRLAGYPDGKGLPEIKVLTSPSYQAIFDLIQYQLSEMGIRIIPDNGEGSSLREMIYQGRAEFWRASWIADYPDPENYLSLFTSQNEAPGGPNTTRYASPEYDRLMEQYLNETDAGRREAICLSMQALLVRDLPVILLYYDRIVRLVRNEVRGLETDGMNNLVLKRAWKESVRSSSGILSGAAPD